MNKKVLFIGLNVEMSFNDEEDSKVITTLTYLFVRFIPWNDGN